MILPIRYLSALCSLGALSILLSWSCSISMIGAEEVHVDPLPITEVEITEPVEPPPSVEPPAEEPATNTESAKKSEEPVKEPVFLGPIGLTNYHDGETIRHTVPLIRGLLKDKTLTSVEVVNESSRRSSTNRITSLAYDGRFKALIELVEGPNKLVVKAGKDTLRFVINYKPQTNLNVLRCIYAVDTSGNKTFQTPLRNDPQDYAGKLSTMMLMLQTFTAERMDDVGMGKRTFNLELDENGKVKVHIMKCDKSAQEVFNMPGGRGALYGYMCGQVKKNMPKDNTRNVVYVGFSRFNSTTKQNQAYTALGTPPTAVFGGSNMYCYPNKIADIQKAFMDATPIDRDHFSNDSNGRNVFWACAATSIGATLHETGHAMDLPHCSDWTGIMARGFDNFHRFWILQEAPVKEGKKLKDFKEERSARWELSSAAFLRFTKWFAMDKRDYTSANRITAKLGDNPDQFIVESPDGVGAVILGHPGLVISAVARDWSKPAPLKVVINAKDYVEALASEKAYLRIIDDQAHVKNISIEAIRKPPEEPQPKKKKSK